MRSFVAGDWMIFGGGVFWWPGWLGRRWICRDSCTLSGRGAVVCFPWAEAQGFGLLTFQAMGKLF